MKSRQRASTKRRSGMSSGWSCATAAKPPADKLTTCMCGPMAVTLRPPSSTRTPIFASRGETPIDFFEAIASQGALGKKRRGCLTTTSSSFMARFSRHLRGPATGSIRVRVGRSRCLGSVGLWIPPFRGYFTRRMAGSTSNAMNQKARGTTIWR